MEKKLNRIMKVKSADIVLNETELNISIVLDIFSKENSKMLKELFNASGQSITMAIHYSIEKENEKKEVKKKKLEVASGPKVTRPLK